MSSSPPHNSDDLIHESAIDSAASSSHPSSLHGRHWTHTFDDGHTELRLHSSDDAEHFTNKKASMTSSPPPLPPLVDSPTNQHQFYDDDNEDGDNGVHNARHVADNNSNSKHKLRGAAAVSDDAIAATSAASPQSSEDQQDGGTGADLLDGDEQEEYEEGAEEEHEVAEVEEQEGAEEENVEDENEEAGEDDEAEEEEEEYRDGEEEVGEGEGEGEGIDLTADVEADADEEMYEGGNDEAEDEEDEYGAGVDEQEEEGTDDTYGSFSSHTFPSSLASRFQPQVVSKEDAVDLTLDDDEKEEEKPVQKPPVSHTFAPSSSPFDLTSPDIIVAPSPPITSFTAAPSLIPPPSFTSAFASSSSAPISAGASALSSPLPPMHPGTSSGASSKPLFKSPFKTSPYPAYSSKQMHRAVNANHAKADFMSPKHRPAKTNSATDQEVKERSSVSPLSRSSIFTFNSPSSPGAAAASSFSSFATPAATPSSLLMSQRRTGIKHWDQAKVAYERRVRKHPNPTRALLSTFPYCVQSLVPKLQDGSTSAQPNGDANGHLPTSLITRPRTSVYFHSTRTGSTASHGGVGHSTFYELERKRIAERAIQLERQTKMIQQYRRRQQKRTTDEIDLTLDSLSMSDVVTPFNYQTQSISQQLDFIGSNIDMRIRHEKVAPAWLNAKIFDELLDEIKEDVIKEIVADAKHTAMLPDAEMKKSAELMQSAPKKVIVDKFNIELVGADLVKLRNLDWLSDQTINFYMEMLSERQKRNQTNSSALTSQKDRIHYFNTFFYEKLSSGPANYSYKEVSRWMKRAQSDPLTLDKIITPIHVSGNHWCLAIINIRQRRFEYYDSLGRHNTTCLQNLRRFLTDEMQARHPAELASFDIPSWTDYTPMVPQQNNGSDCGVFTIKFADYASENRPFTFSHKDMPYFRRRIALEILYQRVL